MGTKIKNNGKFYPINFTTTPELDYENAVQITVAQLYSGYTVPKDGMFVGSGAVSQKDWTGMYIRKNSSSTGLGVLLCATKHVIRQFIIYGQVQCIVAKDNIIKTQELWETFSQFTFIPWK